MKHATPSVGITGANGFVGYSLYNYLSSKKYTVRGFVRHNSSFKNQNKKLDSIYKVDYFNLSELTEAFSQLDILVHCAARSMDWGKKRDFYLANVETVKNVVIASARAGIRKIIHISTANIEGYSKSILDESSVNVPFFKYSKSKLEGENILKTLCEKNKVEYIILRPSAIYGPGDFKWSYQMIDRIKNSWWPLINRGKASFTPLFIENLLKAIELSLYTNNVNSIYNLTDNSIINWKDFSDDIANILNVSPKYKNYPFIIAIIVSIFAKFLHDIFFKNKEPFITPYRVIRSSKDFLYSCARAIRELEYNPESEIFLNLKKTVRWYNSIEGKNKP